MGLYGNGKVRNMPMKSRARFRFKHIVFWKVKQKTKTRSNKKIRKDYMRTWLT